MILEDRLTDAELIVRELRRADFDPDWKQVQAEADFVAALDPQLDVILADYRMPHFNGLQALRLLQQRGLDVPFIMISGAIGEELAAECVKQGVTDYLLKGRLERLGLAVQNAIQEAEARRTRQRAEAALSESKARKAAILESVLDCIVTMNADGTVIEFNAAAERTLGYTKAEAIGQSLADLIIPPRLRDAHRAGLARYLATGEGPLLGKLIEISAMRSDGSEIPVELSITAIRSDKAPIFTGVLRDIAERKRAVEELRERVQVSALGAAVGLALADSDTLANALQRCSQALVTHLEAAFARIWTFNEHEGVLELRASAGLYTHLDGPHGRVRVGQFKIGRIAQNRTAHLTNTVIGDPEVGDQEWARREGMVAFAGHPLIVDGRVVGVMALFAQHALSDAVIAPLASVADHIALGIERHRSAEALRTAEERTRFALEAAGVGIWDMDYATGVLRGSEIFESQLGLQPGTSIATLEALVESIHPLDRDAMRETIAEATRTGADFSAQYRILRPDGTVGWLNGIGRVHLGEHGEPVRGVGISLDVTERHTLV